MNTILGPLLSKIFRKRSAARLARQEALQDALRYGFYSNFMREDDVTFDIGANVGNRTRVFALLSRMVVAVEPQDSCMKILEAEFGSNSRVKLIKKAVGACEGLAEILICNASTMSSLSPEWVHSVQASGRFSSYRWDQKQVVVTTTLDRLIEEFGIPTFIKIDVEGFELQVLRGLSQPVKCISFEFVPEYTTSALRCIEHLCLLGKPQFNFSNGESMQLAAPDWLAREEIETILSKCDRASFGDVYARFWL